MVDGTAAKQVCCYRPAAAPAESFQAAVGPVGLLGRHECCRRRHHSKLGLRTGPGDTPLRPAAAQQVMVVMACCCQGAHGLMQNACAQLLPRLFLPSSVHACAAPPASFSCLHRLLYTTAGAQTCIQRESCLFALERNLWAPALHWLSMIQQRPKTCQRPNGSDASPETRIFSEKAWCQEAVGWIHSHHKLYLSKVVYRSAEGSASVHLYGHYQCQSSSCC